MARAEHGGSRNARAGLRAWTVEESVHTRAQVTAVMEHGCTEKADQTAAGVNVDRLLTTRDETYKYGKAALRMKLVMLDCSEDAGMTSTFRIYRNIEKTQMRMCLYV